MSSISDKDDERDSTSFLKHLVLAREGNQEQQAELLNSFRDYLRAVAINATGPDSDGKLSVSDLVQSAIIAGFNNFEQCRANGKEEFKAWLRQILTNDISSGHRYWRRQKRDVGKEIPVTEDLAYPSDLDDPVAQTLRKEDQRNLAEGIAELSLEYQTVIQLRHQDKLSFVDIGARMNRSNDAARMLWNRAIEGLRKRMLDSEGPRNEQ